MRRRRPGRGRRSWPRPWCPGGGGRLSLCCVRERQMCECVCVGVCVCVCVSMRAPGRVCVGADVASVDDDGRTEVEVVKLASALPLPNSPRPEAAPHGWDQTSPRRVLEAQGEAPASTLVGFGWRGRAREGSSPKRRAPRHGPSRVRRNARPAARALLSLSLSFSPRHAHALPPLRWRASPHPAAPGPPRPQPAAPPRPPLRRTAPVGPLARHPPPARRRRRRCAARDPPARA